MSAVDLTARTDTDILADLDFTPTLPCEHSQHATCHADEPATWVAHVWCATCGDDDRYYICESGRRFILQEASYCPICMTTTRPEDAPATFTPIGTAS